MTEYKNSVVSGAKLESLFSVGELYVSDFLKKGEKPKGPPCEMALGFDPISKAVQLTKQPDASLMWGSMYYYRSAVNPAMREALAELAESTCKSVPEPKEKAVYLDIASNDGYLLSTVDKEKYLRVGIDPSDYPEAKDNTDVNIQEYFSAKAFTDAGYTKAARVSCAACFYDVDNPEEFLKDVYEILEDDGLFTLQVSYTPANILQTELGVGNELVEDGAGSEQVADGGSLGPGDADEPRDGCSDDSEDRVERVREWNVSVGPEEV